MVEPAESVFSVTQCLMWLLFIKNSSCQPISTNFLGQYQRVVILSRSCRGDFVGKLTRGWLIIVSFKDNGE